MSHKLCGYICKRNPLESFKRRGASMNAVKMSGFCLLKTIRSTVVSRIMQTHYRLTIISGNRLNL